jgi:hypothetical protein
MRWQLRAQLPSYLELQREMIVTHCALPSVLQTIVSAAQEDMWADGLRV